MIKLWKVDESENLIRLQSQLSRGKDSVDFIIKDNQLFNWKYYKGVAGFFPCNLEYKIMN